jgi:hypothetical protein
MLEPFTVIFPDKNHPVRSKNPLLFRELFRRVLRNFKDKFEDSILLKLS